MRTSRKCQRRKPPRTTPWAWHTQLRSLLQQTPQQALLLQQQTFLQQLLHLLMEAQNEKSTRLYYKSKTSFRTDTSRKALMEEAQPAVQPFKDRARVHPALPVRAALRNHFLLFQQGEGFYVHRLFFHLVQEALL